MAPLSIAAPAAAAAFAYLDAKYFLSYDLSLIWGSLKGMRMQKQKDKAGRWSFFYNLEDHALNPKQADRCFLWYEGREWTYRQFYEMVLRYGQWLKKIHGVKTNEVIALDCMNRPNFLFLWFGLWSIGAKVAMINYNLTGAPLLHSVKASTARLLLVDDALKPALKDDVMEQLSSPSFREGGGPVQVEFFNDTLEQQLAGFDPVREPDQVRGGQAMTSMAMLIYTSGTTGNPKPGVIDWGRLCGVTCFVPNWLGLNQTDRFYTCMPLYHSAGAVLAVLNSLHTGCALVLGHKFGTRTFFPTVRESKATVIQYVGETLRYLLAVPPSPLDRQHNVRIAFGNGLRPDIWEKFKDRFGIDQINEFYGATEGPSSAWNRSRNSLSMGAIGRSSVLAKGFAKLNKRGSALVEHDIESEEPVRDPQTGFCKQIDTSKKNAPPGELLAKLPDNEMERDVAFPGYYRNKDATGKKVLRDVFIKGDAYFRTGDMVRVDHEGRVYFHDRIGDTFRWRSENVSTNEVAETLNKHPAVAEANVYGVEVPNHDGRAGCASMIMKSSDGSEKEDSTDVDQRTLDELAQHVLKNLPRYAVPVFLRFPRSMQRTGTNKQQKHELRQQGADWEKLSATGDKIFWLKDRRYVPYAGDEWESIRAGKVRL